MKFDQWKRSGLPVKGPFVTGIHSIYVLPSAQGWLFLLLGIIIWLLGTNYQNNLILAVAFLLFSLQFVSIFYVWRNLAGLRFDCKAGEPAFVGQEAVFIISLSSARQRPCYRLQISLVDNPRASWFVSLGAEEQLQLHIEKSALKRGWLPLGRVRLTTRFPFGLIRCWSVVHPAVTALVYPAPVEVAPEKNHRHEGEGQGKAVLATESDFYGFASYQPGAPLSRVAWKQLARGAGLFLKEFAAEQSGELWIDWRNWPGLDREGCLSAMCFQVLEYHRQKGRFGIRLPDQVLAPAEGEAHYHKALRALALSGGSREQP